MGIGITQLDPRLLMLEITERAVMEDAEENADCRHAAFIFLSICATLNTTVFRLPESHLPRRIVP